MAPSSRPKRQRKQVNRLDPSASPPKRQRRSTTKSSSKHKKSSTDKDTSEGKNDDDDGDFNEDDQGNDCTEDSGAESVGDNIGDDDDDADFEDKEEENQDDDDFDASDYEAEGTDKKPTATSSAKQPRQSQGKPKAKPRRKRKTSNSNGKEDQDSGVDTDGGNVDDNDQDDGPTPNQAEDSRSTFAKSTKKFVGRYGKCLAELSHWQEPSFDTEPVVESSPSNTDQDQPSSDPKKTKKQKKQKRGKRKRGKRKKKQKQDGQQGNQGTNDQDNEPASNNQDDEPTPDQDDEHTSNDQADKPAPNQADEPASNNQDDELASNQGTNFNNMSRSKRRSVLRDRQEKTYHADIRAEIAKAKTNGTYKPFAATPPPHFRDPTKRVNGRKRRTSGSTIARNGKKDITKTVKMTLNVALGINEEPNKPLAILEAVRGVFRDCVQSCQKPFILAPSLLMSLVLHQLESQDGLLSELDLNMMKRLYSLAGANMEQRTFWTMEREVFGFSTCAAMQRYVTHCGNKKYGGGSYAYILNERSAQHLSSCQLKILSDLESTTTSYASLWIAFKRGHFCSWKRLPKSSMEPLCKLFRRMLLWDVSSHEAKSTLKGVWTKFKNRFRLSSKIVSTIRKELEAHVLDIQSAYVLHEYFFAKDSTDDPTTPLANGWLPKLCGKKLSVSRAAKSLEEFEWRLPCHHSKTFFMKGNPPIGLDRAWMYLPMIHDMKKFIEQRQPADKLERQKAGLKWFKSSHILPKGGYHVQHIRVNETTMKDYFVRAAQNALKELAGAKHAPEDQALKKRALEEATNVEKDPWNYFFAPIINKFGNKFAKTLTTNGYEVCISLCKQDNRAPGEPPALGNPPPFPDNNTTSSFPVLPQANEQRGTGVESSDLFSGGAVALSQGKHVLWGAEDVLSERVKVIAIDPGARVLASTYSNGESLEISTNEYHHKVGTKNNQRKARKMWAFFCSDLYENKSAASVTALKALFSKDYTAKTLSVNAFDIYLSKLEECLNDLVNYYGSMTHRRRRFNAFQERQRAMEWVYKCVLYGSKDKSKWSCDNWGKRIGTCLLLGHGTFPAKGRLKAPVIAMKNFFVKKSLADPNTFTYIVNEFRTSMFCPICHHKVVPVRGFYEKKPKDGRPQREGNIWAIRRCPSKKCKCQLWSRDPKACLEIRWRGTMEYILQTGIPAHLKRDTKEKHRKFLENENDNEDTA